MLNFRKLRQDFSSFILKEGKSLYDKNKVIDAKILKLNNEVIRFSGKILSNYNSAYESEVEIDRFESQMIHSNCDCPYRYDCQHLAALIFYLEEHIDAILVEYSKEANIDEDENIDVEEKRELLETIKEAEEKEAFKKDEEYQKELLNEYKAAAQILSSSPFFLPQEETTSTKAELALIFNSEAFVKSTQKRVEFQLALRLPSRSKPLLISNLQQFVDAVKYEEPIFAGGKRLFFSISSFEEIDKRIMKFVIDYAHYQEAQPRFGFFEIEDFGTLLFNDFQIVKERALNFRCKDLPSMPSLFWGNLETPLMCSLKEASLRFEMEYLSTVGGKLLLNPKIIADNNDIAIDEAILLKCSNSGIIYKEVYFSFPPHIKRWHLQNLFSIRDMTIPEPLLGTFVENALPELGRFAEVANKHMIEKFVTLPYTKAIKGRCKLTYLEGELEALLYFLYDNIEVSSSISGINFENAEAFTTEKGIIARNLVEEKKIKEELFQDFICNEETGIYVAKTEKKIVEFMTEIIPRYQNIISFECPQNLLDLFVYDKTKFKLKLDYKDKVGFYTLNLEVEGELKGVKLDLLWECVSSHRSFVELNGIRRRGESRFSKILILDLEKIEKLVHIFDELGISTLDSHVEERPLWSIVNIEESSFTGLPVEFSMSLPLKNIKEQMIGQKSFTPSPIPKSIKASIRSYQIEGIHWLEKLKAMYLNGILADDMGLGKTLQAIVAITHHNLNHPKEPSFIVCPTSLLYNWKEEFNRFNPSLKVAIADGIPQQRKKIISQIQDYDAVITSYTLLQKDIELYEKVEFAYAILDEAQNIKNRGTRNAKSAKMIRAKHRLILTGTPIENSLEELWSLFDFLMPGLLSSFERFSEKYVRASKENYNKNMQYLKKKVSPFILRRMKSDVLKELPPVSEIIYHCQLSDIQKQLYHSYAKSAKEELVKLVAKEGFEKVQIHVLATLTRLKQICCHPAIFAKEKVEAGDSTKYDMLIELLQTLVEGGHKTVVFSQYTKMLEIIRDDFTKQGIRFSYLDGFTKNRLQIVKEFNENKDIPVFLVSLKAGGTGLNIIGADTVVHYDMWWNPAVENQATDRVHRIGQTKSVSSYKLVTLGSIEEKIVEMQKRKQGLVKKVVSCDDEAISKLTWEDVLELLKT